MLYTRHSGALLLAAAVGLAPGCTLLADVLPGTPFTPDQPVAEVTVVGSINVGQGTRSCSGAVMWGIAKNSGDVDVDDVYIEIDALDGNRGAIGTYRTHVYNGLITEVTPPETETTPPPETETGPVEIAGTSLAVDESGTFEVCTNLGCESF